MPRKVFPDTPEGRKDYVAYRCKKFLESFSSEKVMNKERGVFRAMKMEYNAIVILCEAWGIPYPRLTSKEIQTHVIEAPSEVIETAQELLVDKTDPRLPASGQPLNFMADIEERGK